MLPVAFKEFGVIYVLLLFFFHYHCDLVKDQIWQKSWGGATALHPPVFTGLIRLVNAEEHRCKVLWTREQGKENSVIDDVMPNTIIKQYQRDNTYETKEYTSYRLEQQNQNLKKKYSDHIVILLKLDFHADVI